MAIAREDKTFYIKEGSALPLLTVKLVDGLTGLPVDLTQADEVRIKISDDEMQIVDAPAEIGPDQDTTGKGLVSVDPTLFSDQHGRYFAEFDVFWTAERYPQTFPHKDYVYLVVVEDVD